MVWVLCQKQNGNRGGGATKRLFFTPLKINMEHNHGGLVQIIFLSKWVIM